MLQGQQARRLRHFHYLDWPDNGVPNQLTLVGFVELVRDQIASRGGPIVVHCRSVSHRPSSSGGIVVVVVVSRYGDRVHGFLHGVSLWGAGVVKRRAGGVGGSNVYVAGDWLQLR